MPPITDRIAGPALACVSKPDVLYIGSRILNARIPTRHAGLERVSGYAFCAQGEWVCVVTLEARERQRPMLEFRFILCEKFIEQFLGEYETVAQDVRRYLCDPPDLSVLPEPTPMRRSKARIALYSGHTPVLYCRFTGNPDKPIQLMSPWEVHWNGVIHTLSNHPECCGQHLLTFDQVEEFLGLRDRLEILASDDLVRRGGP